MLNKVIVILGQTASGKSDLAVLVAKKLNGEIISADSRQVYKGLDIGTGKITNKEMQGVPHHLLDVVKPKQVFTVAQYKKLTEKKIKDIIKRGKIPIICGGTGFYISAVTDGLVLPAVKPNKKLRLKLAQQTNEELLKTLHQLDANRANDIQKKNEQYNKVRLIRAIEIAKSIGSVPKIKKRVSPYEFIKIGILIESETLKQKIQARVKKMFDDGLLAEIEKLKKTGVSEKRLSEFGFEYNQPTVQKVINATLRYAKRQKTWFQRDGEIFWLTTNEVLPFLKKRLISAKEKAR